jgi:hypothetical protein
MGTSKDQHKTGTISLYMFSRWREVNGKEIL